MADIRVREFTSMMIRARRVSRLAGEKVTFDRELLVKLLNTLDELTGMDTSVPNKVTMRRPRCL